MSPDNLRKFEDELKRVPPHRLNVELAGRIDAELRVVARRKRLARIRSVSGWAGVAIAASVLITFGFLLFNGQLSLEQAQDEPPMALESVPDPVDSPSTEADNPFRQVLTENNLQNRIDEGIVFLRNGMTARRYRYQFVDRVVWENPSDGAMVELEVPRDEIVLIPVQTF